MSGIKRTNAPNRKGHLHTGDLIPLGSKSGSTKSRHSDRDDPKQITPSLKSIPPGASSSAIVGPPVKKFKSTPVSDSSSGGLFSDPIRVSQVGPSQVASSKVGPGSISKSTHLLPGGGTSPSSITGGTSPVIEVRSGELLPAFREATASGNDSKAIKLVAGALRQLKLSRLKPDSTLNSALSSIAKENPKLFCAPAIIEGLVAVLKRETSVIFKAKSNSSVYILVTQLLLIALKDSNDWPEAVAKVYVEDSLGDRVWVDLVPCKPLVDNVCTLFQTRPYAGLSSATLSSSSTKISGIGEGVTKVSGSGEGVTKISGSGEGVVKTGGSSGEGTGIGEDDVVEEQCEDDLSLIETEVTPRFSSNTYKSLRTYVVQVVTEQLGRHNMPTDSVSRNMLRFLMSAMGFPEFRLLVAQKIDSWIQNPKLGKLCQELLMTVAVNCYQHGPDDLRVIDALISIRLKTKLFSSQFVTCMKELISSHPDNLATVLKGVVSNELGQYRTPSNMAIISMMIHTWPNDSAKLLGSVFQYFLTRKEDYLRALRGFLREVVRVVRNEFNFTVFARALMQEKSETDFAQLEPTHKERVALSLADLITCSGMLTANMLIREAYNGYLKGERAMVTQLQDFFSSLGLIQRDSVWWVHTIVPGLFRPQPVEYKACLKKVLFLEPAESYSNKDNWPPEADRNLILHLMAEACLKEDTLMRVLVIGLTRELPLLPADAMDIADKLVARAANAHTEDLLKLPSIERKELFKAIFDISAYRPPANIQLPEGYQPPNLAISKLYWKGWILLLVLAAFNPKTIGAVGWNEYSMLRSMMEMVMTNTYTFPMSMSLVQDGDGAFESRDSFLVKEVQLVKLEKETILEYENHLASSSSSQNAAITEANSYLLNQVTQLQPKGPARRVPPTAIELIKTVNRTLKLGHRLCICRSPDFLLDVIEKQGTVESMKWLTELVESSNSSLEILPIPCLCEFLMTGYQDKVSDTGPGGGEIGESDSLSHRTHYKRKKSAKDKAEGRHRKLIGQLRNVLTGPDSTSEGCSSVLEYFFVKLTQSDLTPRKLAFKALRDVLDNTKRTSTQEPESQLEHTEDEEHRFREGNGYLENQAEDWLTYLLPNLTHFTAVLSRVYPLILRACLVETNLGYLQNYIDFLTLHSPHEKLYQSAVEMSRVMIDRFETVQKIFTRSSELSPTANIDSMRTLGSVLGMLRNALQSAIHSQTVPEISSSVDFLLVNFPVSSEKVIIHVALVEAIFLFLSCDLAPRSNPADFAYFLEMWFPSRSKSRPEAFTVETKESVAVPSSSIVPQMLFSNNPKILDEVVQRATPVQLCNFIQSFGCPYQSVQKVLERLDSLCEEKDGATLLRGTLKYPSVVANCVEVQFLRGVKSGRVFLSYLQGLSSLPSLEIVTDISDILEEASETTTQVEGQFSTADLSTGQTVLEVVPTDIPQEKIGQQLLQIFAPSLSRVSASSAEIQKVIQQLEKRMRSLILFTREQSSGGPGKPFKSKESLNAYISGLVAALNKLVSGSSIRRQFVEGMIKHRFSLSLFRLLTKIHCMKQLKVPSASLFKTTVQQILGLLEGKKVASVSCHTLFHSVLSSCAEQLGVKRDLRAIVSSSEKLTSSVKKTCQELATQPNPFENETVLLRTVSDVVQNGPCSAIEDMLAAVAKRSVSLGMEAKCISFLYKVKMATDVKPLALQCFPGLFIDRVVEPDTANFVSDRSDLDKNGTSHSVEVVGKGDWCGLVVDWLETLDPEVVHMSPESSMQMVFGSSPVHKLTITSSSQCLPSGCVTTVSSSLLSGQEYLLGRLAHSASWPTLVKTLSSLLNSTSAMEWINPSAVLNFIWACLHKPSLWQERVKRDAVVNSSFSLGINEDCQLKLTPPQLASVITYIMKEAAEFVAGTKGLTSLTAGDQRELSVETKEVIYARLPLLMTCCHADEVSLGVVVKQLQTSTSFPSLSWQLLVQLYQADDKVIFAVDHPQTLSVAVLDSTMPSKLDTELHYLLLSMADAKPEIESRQKMTCAALVCRKIAILHPALMLRQLPMMGWLLRGRVHLAASEFKKQNHKHVFVNMFSILELLRPLVFKTSQTDYLNSCLEPFFGFLKKQCLVDKKHQAFVNSFADFLVQYAQYNRDKAAPIIFEHLEVLSALSDVYTSKKSNLKALVKCFPNQNEEMSVLYHSQSHQFPTVPSDSVLMAMVPPTDEGHSLSHEQVMPFLKKLESGRQREDILKVLQDLDETSHHSVDILKHFVPELCRIIQDPELTSCTTAHNLLLRHFKRSPSSANEILPSFIGCLESQNHQVVMATVSSISNLVLLCKAQDACYLLNKLFSLSVNPSFNCTSELIKAIESCTSHTFK